MGRPLLSPVSVTKWLVTAPVCWNRAKGIYDPGFSEEGEGVFVAGI